MPRATTDRLGSGSPARSGPATQLNDLRELVVGYAKQETVDPLRTLGRSLGFGIAGSVLIGAGLSLLLLALLRGLQQIQFFNDPVAFNGGRWSWLPYLITSLVGLLLVVFFTWRLVRFVSGPSTAASTVSGGTR